MPMPDLNHADLIEELHERQRVRLLKLTPRSIDMRKGEMRIDRTSAEPRKIFHASQNAALRKLFNNGRGQARHFFGIRGKRSLRHDRTRQTKVEHRREVEIETRGFQLRSNDARAKPKLGETCSGKF